MKICPVCRNTYPDEYESCPRDRSDLQTTDPALAAGAVLRGKYEVLSELGKGGMATVYKVRHLAFHDVLAVKVVHAEFANDADFIKRFRNEAVVARQLKHENAVHIEDFDYAEDGRPFIVMEYVEGQSLFEASLQENGPWPTDRSLAIAGQVASALGAAHDIGIVHRDIKPANILLTPGGGDVPHVKVLDFGIAKTSEKAFAGMTSVKTQASFVIGTPEYMSPEQAVSGEAAVDGRSDLYALGVVLYEMVTGTHPFRAETPIAMLVHQMQTRPEAPRSLHEGVPESVSALVVKSLEKKPEDRFQSAAEMLAAMQDPEGWWAGERRSGSHAAEDFLEAEQANAALETVPTAVPQTAFLTPPAAPDAVAAVDEPAAEAQKAEPAVATLSAEDAASVANFGAGRMEERVRVPQPQPRASGSGRLSGVRQAANPQTDPAVVRAASPTKKGSSGRMISFALLLVVMIGVIGFYVHTTNQAAEHPEPTVQRPADAPPATTPDSAAASSAPTLQADAQFCDGSSCRSTFTRSAMRRVQLRLKLRRSAPASLQKVVVRAVVWGGGKALSDRQLPPCVLPAGKNEASCDTAGAFGRPAIAFRPDSYRLELYGDGMEHLATQTITVTD